MGNPKNISKKIKLKIALVFRRQNAIFLYFKYSWTIIVTQRIKSNFITTESYIRFP